MSLGPRRGAGAGGGGGGGGGGAVRLRCLNLTDNECGDGVLDVLADALRDGPLTLNELHLRHNPISREARADFRGRVGPSLFVWL